MGGASTEGIAVPFWVSGFRYKLIKSIGGNYTWYHFSLPWSPVPQTNDNMHSCKIPCPESKHAGLRAPNHHLLKLAPRVLAKHVFLSETRVDPLGQTISNKSLQLLGKSKKHHLNMTWCTSTVENFGEHELIHLCQCKSPPRDTHEHTESGNTIWIPCHVVFPPCFEMIVQ